MSELFNTESNRAAFNFVFKNELKDVKTTEPRCIIEEGGAPYPNEDIGATYCNECEDFCKNTGNPITSKTKPS
jgi:hypothetical protein